MVISRFIHVVANGFISLFLMLTCVCVCVYVHVCVDMHTYVIHLLHLSVSALLGCFYDLAVAISAAVNLGDACTFSNYSCLWIYVQEWHCRIIW